MKKGTGASYKQGRITAKGGAAARSGRPPAEGERKALRKRVVLSNTNALEVQGLEDLSAKNAAEESSCGQVLGLPNEAVDALRAVRAFKPTQGWSLFRRPSTLMTRHTHKLAKAIAAVESNKSTSRLILTGEKGSGKSVLQLQALATAFLRGFVIIHIPEAQELTIGHTSYTPSSTPPASGATLYDQPHYTATLLSNIAKANATLLSTLKVETTHDLPIPLQSNISLSRLAALGASDPEIAPAIYAALWTELLLPNRPPILYALDSLPHAMTTSAYLDAAATPIHAHDLSLIAHFVSFLRGDRALPNGGLVVAADSRSNRPPVPTLEHVLASSSSRAAGKQADYKAALDARSPYHALDDRVVDALRDVEVVTLAGLSKDECRAVMEYYARSGMLRQRVDDRLVGEKWTLAGGGIVGEVERGSVVMRV